MLREMVIDGCDIPEDGTGVDPADGALVRVAEGDQRAFASLYDMLSARAFGLIKRVLVDHAQSEEVLQEVFLEVWQRATSYSPERGSARTWVLTMAHRRSVDRVRAAQASAGRDMRAGLRELYAAPVPVEEHVELLVDGTEAAEALQLLPEVQREPLMLAYFGGYTQQEIAVLLGAPLGTIKTRMRDGLSRLRVTMEGAS
ncbi:sigma-70 family RNA polymerase sigma factor [Leucobacter salsicius]|uniref:sigma-70 family RNA polymerase sigma factor n=1 Tax=Leucobacter salsicius TaxID=664638 RepID=UPI0004757A37|nr:sigma-70 family RNA polymerase sigma factor [Leucobacter salsicius]